VIRAAVAGLLVAGMACAQSIYVGSPFRRIGPDGEPVRPDQGGRPREILSPALARNAHGSFHVAVRVPASRPFTVHISQNPEEGVRFTLYREVFRREPAGWIPDALVRVALPYTGQPSGATGDRVTVFWLDLWVERQAPVRRVRLETQLNVGNDWIIYPMELRVLETVVPDLPERAAALPPVSAPAEAAARLALRQYLCGETLPGATEGLTVRRLILRNALEDMALARKLERDLGAEAVAKGLLEPLGVADPKPWCSSAASAAAGPEWYLRVRDFLYRNTID